MFTFLDQPKSSGFLDQNTPTAPTFERPENYDKTALEQGEEILSEVKARIKEQASSAYTQSIVDRSAEKEEPSAVAEDIVDGEQKLLGIYSADDVYIEDAIIGSNPGYTATDHRYYRNLQIMSEEFERAAVEQEDRSWVGYAVDFVDREIFRQAVFGFWEDLTNRTARQGAEFAEVLFTESDPSKVREFARIKVDEARSEGILTGDNYFAYNQLMREAYSVGYNPDVGFDRLFAALDLTAFAGAAIKIGGKGLTLASRAAKLKSTTAATRAGAFGGVDAADKTSLNIHIKDIDPINTANRQSSSADLAPGSIRPAVGPSVKHEINVKLAERISPNIKRGAVPDEALDADWISVKTKSIEAFKKNTKASVYDTKIFDLATELGSVRKAIVFQLGKDEGKAFRAVKGKGGKLQPESGAQKFADRIGGVVTPLDPEDLSKGYTVNVTEALDPREMGFKQWDIALAKTKWHRIASILDNSFIGGAAQRGLADLNQLALRSESASKFLVNSGQDYINKIGRLSFDETRLTNAILADYRDKVKATSGKEWSRNDFEAEWKALTGDLPSDKVYEAFEAASALEDTAWLMAAEIAVKDAISKGFKNAIEVADNYSLPARRKTLKDIPNDADIVDLRGDIAAVKTKGQLSDFGDDLTVWETSEKFNGKEYFVFPSKPPRVVNHADVFGYAGYGRRTNEELNYFTFILNKDGELKTMLGSVSKRDADIAQDQLAAIQDAYKKANNEAEIDEVIQRNNDWNTKVNNKADMDEWLAKNRIDIYDGKISTRFRDAPYENTFDKLYNGDSLGDVIFRKQSRSQTPITQFGGDGPYNPDPLESIVKNFGSVSHRYAWNAYTYKSINGWLAQADEMMKKNMSVAFQIPKSLSPRVQFLEAKVIGTSPEASRMRELHAIIKRQMMMTTDFDLAIEAFSARATEELFNLTGKRISIGDPTNAILTTGFFSAFAFNLSQMFLQGSTVIQAIAIAGRNGLKGMVAQTHLRLFMSRLTDSASEAEVIRRLSKLMELPEDKTREIAELFKEVLPNVVTSDIMELGTTSTVGLSSGGSKAKFFASKFGKKFLDVGYIPFNQGEALGKSTAFMTAAIEFAQKNPNLSILSEAGRNYVARRSSSLSQNMTMAMRGAAQTGFWRVPSQWLNFFFRSFEQVFIGRDLTLKERAYLGFAIMPLYGMTGLGMGQAADEVAEFLGLNPEDENDQAKFVALKYGLLDGFINYFTPFDVALSARMAPATAVWDIYDKFTQEGVLTAFGGPSGSILATGMDAFHNLGSNLYNGYTGTLTEDSLRVLRNFAGINNIAQAVGILQDDVYRNRKGIRLPVEVDVTDAIIAVTGFTPIEVTELYGQIGENINLAKDFKKLEKRVRESSQIAWSVYGSDPDRASQILEDMRTVVSKAPLSYEKKRELLRLLLPNMQTYRDVSKALYDNDRAVSAQWFESILGKGE